MHFFATPIRKIKAFAKIRRRRVWYQSEGERALIRALRDAMRDFVAIPYNARGALITCQSFGLDKKRTKHLLRSFFGTEQGCSPLANIPAACRLQASLTRSARRMRTHWCAVGATTGSKPLFADKNKKDTDWWSGSCLRQSHRAMP